MTTAAVLFMTISVSVVVLLTAWCYYQVLKPPDRCSGSDETGHATDQRNR